MSDAPLDAARYGIEVDLTIHNSAPTQQVLMTGWGKRVLDVGCSTGFTARALSARGCAVVGIEIDGEAAERAEKHCERVIVGDVEHLDLPAELGDDRFDVVILGDVLEHLVDPETILRRLRTFLGPDAFVIASIPNVTHGSIRALLLSGRFHYTETGLLDRTHLRFFDRFGVEGLFRSSGFAVREWRRTFIDPFESELGLDEDAFPAHVVHLARTAPEARTFQFIVRAHPVEAGDEVTRLTGLDLIDREELARRNLAVLAEAEVHARNLGALVELRTEELERSQARLEERTEALDWLEGEYRRTREELEDVAPKYEAVVQGVVYRLLMKVRRLIDRLGPWGSRRRSLILTPARAGRMLMTEGIPASILHLFKPWRWLPRMWERAWPDLDRLTDQQRYVLWLETQVLAPKVMRRAKRASRGLEYRPLISLVMPVHDSREGWLRSAFVSVLGQVYRDWELCVVDDASTLPETRRVLEEFERKDPRIRVRCLEENVGIGSASNVGLSMASGEFVGFLDHDDELKKNALYEVAKRLNEQRDLDYLYSDEDKREEDGALSEPFFKPGWSPNLLMSVNYVTHFSVYRRSFVDRLGGFRKGFDGSQDYDLVLRATEGSDRIGHIALPLYTWRKVEGSAAADVDAKGYAYEAGRRALEDAIGRRGYEGRVEEALVPGRYRVRYEIQGRPRVTIIIPTRDKVDFLRRCVRSIREKTTYSSYEIMIVDNDSVEPETRSFLDGFDGRVVPYPHPFNYAKMMNHAVAEARGADVVVFLNNDTEIISEGWLEAMLEHVQRPEVAAVGARLLYENGGPQHEGIVIGLGGGSAGNADLGGFHELGRTIRDCTAVTGACMMMRHETFLELGGMEERLGVAFNDVDLCLRAREKGYQIVYTPYAELTHHESATRGSLHPDEDEQFYRDRWGNPGEFQDPYYNPNLSLTNPFKLRIDLS